MSEPEFDADDVVWTSPHLNPAEYVVYADRALTTREWVRVHIFRRRDPRLLGSGSLKEDS